MGSAVQYTVVRDGQVRTTFLGGGHGYGLDYHVAVGPELMTAWLDDVHDETARPVTRISGGVLLDVDQRLMLAFSDLPWLNSDADAYGWRRAMLDGWSRTWPGWRIVWAYDGAADLARYAGGSSFVGDSRYVGGSFFVGGSSFAGDESRDEPGPTADLPVDTDDDPGFLITVDGSSWVLPGWADPPWEYGPRLIDLLAGRDQVTLGHVPIGGLHLDVGQQRARLWTIRPLHGVRDRWPRLWPGWELSFEEDRHPADLPAPDPGPALDQLAERVRELWAPERVRRLSASPGPPAGSSSLDAIETSASPGPLGASASPGPIGASASPRPLGGSASPGPIGGSSSLDAIGDDGRAERRAARAAARRAAEAALPGLQRLAEAQARLILGD